MKKFILLTICLITVYSARAYDFEHNGFYYNILSLSDLTVELTCQGVEDEEVNKTASYTGDITIPKTTEFANKTFTVIKINPLAFVNCNIGTLTIPETIESIGQGGKWYQNRGMYGIFSNLVIEDCDTPIKCDYALVNNEEDRSSGKKVSDVTNSVYIGRDIKGGFGNIVYNHWGWDTKSGSYKTITFGPKVTNIPARCCVYCPNLTEVNIPSNIKSIGSDAFKCCTALTTIHGECITELDYGVFADCQNLISFDFPSLRRIHNDCFARCTSLKDVVLPSGLVALCGDSNGGAFNGCSSLENIVIPSTIAKIGQYNSSGPSITKIFVGCSSLKSISIDNPTPVDFSENNLDMLSFLSTTLKVPLGAKKAYSEAAGWKNFSNIVEDPALVGDVYTIYEQGYSYAGSLDIIFEDALEPYVLDYLTKCRFAKKGTVVTIDIKPAYKYYKIESLLINGVDVASEVVSNKYSFTVTGSVTISSSFIYDENAEAGISQTESDSSKVMVSSGRIIVKNASPSETIQICDETGRLLTRCIGNNTEQSFPISKTGVYIVKVGSKTAKIAL